MTLEEKISAAANKKLNDGTIDMIIDKCVEDAIRSSVNDLFGWNGACRKAIDRHFKDLIVPVIDKYDFKSYTTKLEAVLDEIIENTSLADNQKLLNNFKALMVEPAEKELDLSKIFSRYCHYVRDNIDNSLCSGDGKPCQATARMEMRTRPGWHDGKYLDVDFTCDQDEGFNVTVSLYRWYDGKYAFDRPHHIDIRGLSYMDDFLVYISTLVRAGTYINIDGQAFEEQVKANDGNDGPED